MEIENPDLKAVVQKENPMKEWLVNYVGDKLKPENGQITVEMIVGEMLKEFPEFVWAIAEENWVRGYKQATVDFEADSVEVKNE